MGKNLIQAALPIATMAALPAAAGAFGAGGALGAGTGAVGGAFGSADMLAAGAAGGLLPGATAAVPGTIETAGLLDMGGGNLINPEYFVGESMGMPLYAGSPDAPFMERAGNVLSSLGDKMGGQVNPLRMMNMGQPQEQQVARPPAIQRPQSQPATEVSAPYSQAISGGVQFTDAQKEMLRQRMLGGLMYG